MNKIGKRIKKLRLEKGLSQRELASEGVTYAYISRIEAGTRNPSLKALIKLAPKLDTTALYLLTGMTGHCPVCGCNGKGVL
jgi:transcriptional regulator with XRE-family HTH domain